MQRIRFGVFEAGRISPDRDEKRESKGHRIQVWDEEMCCKRRTV
jgi:hypothetical protein